MAFDANQLRRRLLELEAGITAARYLVGFSGGLDSTVLVHALKRAVDEVTPVIAVHINHGLHADASAWENHCRRVAATLGVDFVSRHVDVKDHGGYGLEAAARAERYAAMKTLMQEGDVLLSAHHEEDQAETLLLNLMRGSGLAGLAAIGARQQFGPGLLIRPMLKVSRKDIERYARAAGLAWVEDPANANLRFDRNFLRREILPRLRQRWPAVSRRLANSAELAGEAARLQDDLARLDLSSLLGTPAENGTKDHDSGEPARPDRLDVAGLRKLAPPRQRNVLRFAIRASGLPPAPATGLSRVQDELLTAREDAAPLVSWSGAQVRRFRQTLYLLPETAFEPRTDAPLITGDGRAVEAGASLGALRLLPVTPGEGPGLDSRIVANGLHLRFRAGGERIRPFGRRESRPLKKLLQEQGVVPWMRQYVPLLYAGEKLAAVADLWIAAECAQETGFRVYWENRPALF